MKTGWRPVFPGSSRLCVCLLLQDLVQSCLRGGGFGSNPKLQVGLCVFITAVPIPSRTNERGGEGYCVKEGEGEEGERERERAGVCVFITAGPIIKLCAGWDP